MNDPDSPNSSEIEPSRPDDNWLKRLASAVVSKLTSTSLRKQMEGALAEDDGADQTVSEEEKAMLRNILALRGLRVDDVMVPRAEIDAVEDDITLGTLLALYQEVGHSRLPVYRETLDDPIGMVHIKDVVSFLSDKGKAVNPDLPNTIDDLKHLEAQSPVQGKALLASPSDENDDDNVVALQSSNRTDLLVHQLKNHPQAISNIDLQRPLHELGVIREILFVPPTMPATDLMAKMRAARTQMALVIDEYGGTDGLVSLEDVVETVFGDIEDEHDDDEASVIAEAGPNLFIADARAGLDEVTKTIGTELPLDEEDMDEVDTLGGFIFTHIGRIPVRGELIAVSDGLEIEIIDADPRRIRRVKIRLKPTRKIGKRGAQAQKPSEDEEVKKAEGA